MKNKRFGIWLFNPMLLLAVAVFSCKPAEPQLDVETYLDFAVDQMARAVEELPDTARFPRHIKQDSTNWQCANLNAWTSGFWPGLLWYAYEYTGDDKWKQAAMKWTSYLEPTLQRKYKDHDLGFLMYCSYGNGLRLTSNQAYIPILIRTADSLCSLYNPNVGTILSWPSHLNRYEGYHNTIMDNMMNLELLLWAFKQTGDERYRTIALTHARTSADAHIRPDSSTYHVYLFDPETGAKIKGITRQGAFDESMWARGQAWAVYGFTMVYRETGEPDMLKFAQMVADKYIRELPEDLVPYWDFRAQGIPDEHRDASAAAIAASGLLDLSALITDKSKSGYYHETALRILASLGENYLSDGSNVAILEHSVGDFPSGSEVDMAIIYADYYYAEALLKEKKLREVRLN